MSTIKIFRDPELIINEMRSFGFTTEDILKLSNNDIKMLMPILVSTDFMIHCAEKQKERYEEIKKAYRDVDEALKERIERNKNEPRR